MKRPWLILLMSLAVLIADIWVSFSNTFPANNTTSTVTNLIALASILGSLVGLILTIRQIGINIRKSHLHPPSEAEKAAAMFSSFELRIRIVCGIVLLLSLIPSLTIASFLALIPIYIIFGLFLILNRKSYRFFNLVVFLISLFLYFIPITLFIGPDVFRCLPSYLKSRDLFYALILILFFIIPKLLLMIVSVLALFRRKIVSDPVFYFSVILLISLIIPFMFNKDLNPFGPAGGSSPIHPFEAKILEIPTYPWVPGGLDYDKGRWIREYKFKNISDKEAYVNRIVYFGHDLKAPFGKDVTSSNGEITSQGIVFPPGKTIYFSVAMDFPVSKISIYGSTSYRYGY